MRRGSSEASEEILLVEVSGRYAAVATLLRVEWLVAWKVMIRKCITS